MDEFLRKEARKTVNKKVVVMKSIEHIDDHSVCEEDDSNNLDADWLNHFEEVAEKATSERMRDLWGRVLAGEIRKPGTFSLSTIRFLRELDAEIARVFGEVANRRLPNGLIARPNKLEGSALHEMSFLEEAGLLQEVFGHLGADEEADEDGFVNYYAGKFLLRLKAERLRLPFILITRVGREICQILPEADHISALEHLFGSVEEKVEAAEILGKVRELEDGRAQFTTVKVLKQAEQA